MSVLLPVLNKETEKLKQKQSGNCRDIYAALSSYTDRLYPEELFPLKSYEFEGELFGGPNNADIFLRRCYGDYMRLPPEDARKPHNVNVKFLA